MKIIYPNQFEIEVEILNKQELSELIMNKYGVVSKSFHKDLTARTYSIDSNRLVIEFYDKQGVLVSNIEDFERLKKVRFLKNQVGFLHPRISYYFEISEDEADILIAQFNGKHLKTYESEFEDYFGFKVFQLSNNQVIIRYEGESTLYEDLEALAFDNGQVLNILYPNGFNSGQDEFIKGNLPEKFNINKYFIDPNSAGEIIETHQLIKIREEVKFDLFFESILYQSEKGYFILMQDFDQLNRVGAAKIGIGSAYIFHTLDDFEKEYKRIVEWKREYESNHGLKNGVHIYKELSDKYGKDFPNHTFDELNKLPSILNFDPKYIEFSNKCSSIISESIKWNYGSEEFLDKIIHPVLAYIGEYLKSEGSGDWNMKLDRDGKIWEPWFTDSEWKELFDIINLYKDFLEAEYGIPLVEFYIKG